MKDSVVIEKIDYSGLHSAGILMIRNLPDYLWGNNIELTSEDYLHKRCFIILETSIYDIYVLISDENKKVSGEEMSENLCFIKKKDGSDVTELPCCYIWIHKEGNLDLISNDGRNACHVRRVSKTERVIDVFEELESDQNCDKYRLTIANEYHNIDYATILLQNEYISDGYLVMSNLTMSGFAGISYAKWNEIFVINSIDYLLGYSDSILLNAYNDAEYPCRIEDECIVIKSEYRNYNSYSYSHKYYNLLDMKEVSHYDSETFYQPIEDEYEAPEKYGGYNGYDDDTIDDAFEGDPEATWNID